MRAVSVTIGVQFGASLESAHAVAEAAKIARKRPKSDTIVITLSGRGDKDVEVVEEYLRKNVKNR